MKSNTTYHGSSAITRISSMIVIFLMMATAALMVNGRLFGFTPGSEDSANFATHQGDTTIVNTTAIGKDIVGYGGPTPLEISMVDGRIVSVEALDNDETPGFFARVVKSGLLDEWNGLTAAEAAALEPDGVTGATYSSKAVIANVRTAMAEMADTQPASSTHGTPLDAEHVAVIAILIAAMSLPLFIKWKRYRTIQQILNVAILGFWGGTFLDFTLMLNVASNGLSALAAVSTVLLLIIAFIYPLFGKEGYYCAWVCPLGSIQELASKCNPRHRIRIGQRTAHMLTTLRIVLWGALMLCLWTGLWVGWIDYELFMGFIVDSAATGILIASALIVALSFFIPRPYCRFICPTGTLIRIEL